MSRARTLASRSAVRRLTAAVLALVAALALAWPTPAQAADDVVEIRNAMSPNGLRADVMWASTAAYQGVFLWPNNTSLSQEFTLLRSSNGFFRIQARHSGQCLMIDWRQGSYVNGTKVIQYPYCNAGYSPAEWIAVTMPPATPCNACFSDGYVVLKNRATGRCLDAANGSTNPPAQQAVLQQWDCITSRRDWNVKNQLWDLVPVYSGPDPVVK